MVRLAAESMGRTAEQIARELGDLARTGLSIELRCPIPITREGSMRFSTPMAHPRPRGPGQVAGARRALLTCMVLGALGVCHGAGTEGAAYRVPVSECLEYAELALPCFGDRAAERLRASFSVPPASRGARDALRVRCVARAVELRAGCH